MLKCVRIASLLGFVALLFSAPSTQAAGRELEEVARFAPADGARAGFSVDLVGDYAAYTRVYGASVDFAHRAGPGDEDWEISTVPAPVLGQGFGAAVAFNADATEAFVSSTRSASIHIYSRAASNTWVLDRTITPPALPARVSTYSNTFGEALAYSNGTLVVGVPNATVDGLSNAGFAFAVDLTTPVASWRPLIPASPIYYSITGQSVAIQGSHVAVSAVQNRDAGGLRVGGVYLWDLSSLAEPRFTSQPTNDPKTCLYSDGGGPAFGMSLAFTGGMLAVGSPLEVNYTAATPGCTQTAVDAGQTTQGAVYFFDTNLTQLGGKLTPPPHTEEFAHSIAADGDVLLASGAHAPDYAGEVYVFDTTTIDTAGTGDVNGRQAFAPVQTLVASDPSPGSYFGEQLYGRGLQVSGDRALIAAPQARSNAGSVYVFYPVGAPAVSYTVTFDSRGGSSVAAVTVPAGDRVAAPADPTRSGYAFTGWHTDAAATAAYDFTTPVTADLTLYAGWRAAPTPTAAPTATPTPASPAAAARRPSLRFSKVADRKRVRTGGIVRYRLRVENSGRGDARGVRVCDRLPTGLQYVSTGGARVRGREACYTLKTLRARSSRTFTLRVRAESVARAQTICNTARLSARGIRLRRARACVQLLPGRQACPARAAQAADTPGDRLLAHAAC